MKKVLFFGLLSSLALLTFTGCMDKDITCNDDAIKEKVIDLTNPSLEEQLIMMNIKETSGMQDLLSYALIKQTEALGIEANYSKIKDYDKFKKNANEFVSTARYEFKNVTTTMKDENLNKIECKSELIYSLNNSLPIEFKVNYLAQLSDDKKSTNIEVLGFEVK